MVLQRVKKTGNHNKFFNFLFSFFEIELKLLFVLIILYIVGLIVGVVCIKYVDKSATNELISVYSNFTGEPDKGFVAFFLATISLRLKFIIISFLLGFTVIGFPILFLLPVYKGFGTGFISAFIITQFGSIGTIIGTFSILIPNLLAGVCLVFAVHQALRLSLSMYALFQEKRRFVSPKDMVSKYMKTFFILIIISIVFCVLEALLIPTCYGLVNI